MVRNRKRLHAVLPDGVINRHVPFRHGGVNDYAAFDYAAFDDTGGVSNQLVAVTNNGGVNNQPVDLIVPPTESITYLWPFSATNFSVAIFSAYNNCDCLCKNQPSSVVPKFKFNFLAQLLAILNSYPHSMSPITRLKRSAFLRGGFTDL